MELVCAVRESDTERVKELLESGCTRNSLAIDAAIDVQNTYLIELLGKEIECTHMPVSTVCMRGDIFLFTFMWKKGYPVDWYQCYSGAQVNGLTKMCTFLQLVYPGPDYPLHKCIRCDAIYGESKFKQYLEHRTWCKKRKHVEPDKVAEAHLKQTFVQLPRPSVVGRPSTGDALQSKEALLCPSASRPSLQGSRPCPSGSRPVVGVGVGVEEAVGGGDASADAAADAPECQDRPKRRRVEVEMD